MKCVGTLITWPHTAGGHSQRGSPKSGANCKCFRPAMLVHGFKTFKRVNSGTRNVINYFACGTHYLCVHLSMPTIGIRELENVLSSIGHSTVVGGNNSNGPVVGRV